MNTADFTPHYPRLSKLVTLILCFCFLSACTTGPASSAGQTPARGIVTRTPFLAKKPSIHKTAEPAGATITPLSNRLGKDSSFNGGTLSLDYSTGNLWDKIPTGFQLPDYSDNPAVQSQLRWFINHRQYLDRTAKRAAPYLYYIYDQVQQRELPMELVLLPINESAYNPFATSGRGAGGIWQMIRGTASQYGVKQNWWYDGRRDIHASTKAALDHLTYLQKFFDGDWLLAIAAYDCGEGTVQRAIRRNAAQGKPTDFWSLPLPEETRAYVPRLLALATLLRDHQAYNLELPPVDDQPYLAQVDVEAPINLAEAAQLAGMDLSELKKLNPGHKYSGKVPVGSFKLALPIDRVDIFRDSLNNYTPRGGNTRLADYAEDEVRVEHTTHHQHTPPTISPTPLLAEASTRQTMPTGQPLTRLVKKGENLATIAKLYKVSPKDILKWNHLTASRLKPGTRLVVGFMDSPPPPPAVGVTSTSKKRSTALAKNTTPTPPKLVYYTVRQGDTLTRVAKRHRTSIASLQSMNHLRGHALKPGQKLLVG